MRSFLPMVILIAGGISFIHADFVLPPGCSYYYDYQRNTFVIDSIADTSPSPTEDGVCRLTCNNMNDCYGYIHLLPSKDCYLVVEDLTQSTGKMVPLLGSHYYIKNASCPVTQSTSTTLETTTTTVGTTSRYTTRVTRTPPTTTVTRLTTTSRGTIKVVDNSVDCDYPWLLYKDYDVVDGVKVTYANTLRAQCELICLDAPYCIGFATSDSQPLNCTVYIRVINDWPDILLFPAKDIILRILKRMCKGCTFPWVKFPNLSLDLGQLQTNTKITLRECQQKCFTTSTCIGINYISNPDATNPCILYDSSLSNRVFSSKLLAQADLYLIKNQCLARSSSTVVNPGTTTKAPMETWCPYHYTVEGDTFILGSESPKEVQDANKTECENYCSGRRSCVAYSFHQREGCYIVSDVRYLTLDTTMIGMLLFKKQVLCTDGCVDKFRKIDNKVAIGKPQMTFTFISKDACLKACEDSKVCVVLLYQSNGICYHFDEPSVVDNLLDQPGSVVYFRKWYCYQSDVTTTSPPPPKYCTNPWRIQRDHFLKGGIPRPEIRTLEGCKEFCLGLSNCPSFDFGEDVYPIKCFTHKDDPKMEEVPIKSKGVNHYVSNNCKAFPPTKAKAVVSGATLAQMNTILIFMGMLLFFV